LGRNVQGDSLSDVADQPIGWLFFRHETLLAALGLFRSSAILIGETGKCIVQLLREAFPSIVCVSALCDFTN
jgi:hypothetical protein